MYKEILVLGSQASLGRLGRLVLVFLGRLVTLDLAVILDRLDRWVRRALLGRRDPLGR